MRWIALMSRITLEESQGRTVWIGLACVMMVIVLTDAGGPAHCGKYHSLSLGPWTV